ncbi:hypothetical protein H8E88_21395 [candidate division KSB1 bacterium]|nr:hypothetical protein [candidate division KSB1 bacterium]MBL7094084.1 hypothetical protein [candidate division KSB1 bacterium]
MTQDQELLSFTAQILEQNGGAVEQHESFLMALLPDKLSHLLKMPEEVRIGENGTPLLYGSPLLDNLVQFATQEAPVVYGELKVDYLKKAGFEQLINQKLSFGKVPTRFVKKLVTVSTYMVLICRYLAMSDERKEGLIEVALHEENGAIISGLAGQWQNYHPGFFSQTELPSHFPTHVDDIIRAAMISAQVDTKAELAGFFKGIRRHLNRDVKNTREYYQALQREMEANLENPKLSEEQRNQRKEKINDLPAEMDRKITDLEQKYQVKINITTCAALRFLIPVVRLTIEIKYRKLVREIHVNYNPISHSLDPLVCERCGETTWRVNPFDKDSGFLLVCSRCNGKN